VRGRSRKSGNEGGEDGEDSEDSEDSEDTTQGHGGLAVAIGDGGSPITTVGRTEETRPGQDQDQW